MTSREQVAASVAAGYASQQRVAAVLVTGSVGRGRDDEFSDVEVDVYWTDPPGEQERAAAVRSGGGCSPTLWPFDADDEEWSDDFSVAGTSVGVSGFCVDTVRAVLARQDEFRVTDQLRLSALLAGQVHAGDDLVASWRTGIQYSDALQRSAVDAYLRQVPTSRWRQADALVTRRDWLAARQVCDQSLEACVGLWHALSRTYVEHPRQKWSQVVVPTLAMTPDRAAERLERACRAPLPDAVELARGLTTDTLELVDGTVGGSLAGAALRAMTARR